MVNLDEGSGRAPDEYSAYVKAEWELFFADPARARASLAATERLTVKRVLDVGCGSAQELVPFVANPTILAVGVDLAPQLGELTRRFLRTGKVAGRIAFARASAESLPFRPHSFDVVICRLALPYTDNRLALCEMARVLREGGVCLLKVHHARFYLEKLFRSCMELKPLGAIHALRVLTGGAAYHLFGKQPRNRLTGKETFQTAWLLRRELKKCKLHVVGEMPDTNPATPSLIITRTNENPTSR
jgi:SAM-dependent methyltransferase